MNPIQSAHLLTVQGRALDFNLMPLIIWLKVLNLCHLPASVNNLNDTFLTWDLDIKDGLTWVAAGVLT